MQHNVSHLKNFKENDFENLLNHGVSICADAIAIELFVMHTIEKPWQCIRNHGNVSTLVLKNVRINPSAAYAIICVC